MDTDEAKQMARDYFDDVSGTSSEKGFEIVNVARFDFKEWEVECRIFSTTLDEMVGYVVVISDDVAVYVKGGLK